eukprot:1158779-Pelagomonas_calceolata.AAC.4
MSRAGWGNEVAGTADLASLPPSHTPSLPCIRLPFKQRLGCINGMVRQKGSKRSRQLRNKQPVLPSDRQLYYTILQHTGLPSYTLAWANSPEL